MDITNSLAHGNECADPGQLMDERATGEQGRERLPAALGGRL